MCHDVPNLGIIDGSVFVTAGGVNPTPTICALALRTAEHLIQTRGRHEPVPEFRPAPFRQPAPAPVPVMLTVPTVPLAAGLSNGEREAFARIADALIPSDELMPSASDVGVHRELLDRVLRARPDLLEPLRRAIGGAADARDGEDKATRRAVALIVAGGYYMSPRVRDLLHYPQDVSQPVPNFGFPDYLEAGLLDHMLEPDGALSDSVSSDAAQRAPQS